MHELVSQVTAQMTSVLYIASPFPILGVLFCDIYLIMERSASLNTPSSISSPFSPLRNAFVEDYESGMEASASSMASGGDEEEEDDDDDDFSPISRPTQQIRDQEAFKRMQLLQSKRFVPPKKAMASSGNSSTDSNAPSKKPDLFKAPFQSSPVTMRVLHTARKEDVPTPSSGYDGDTEGPLNEDSGSKIVL